MPSLDSLNDLLTQAAKLLDMAAEEIRDVPLEPKKENIRLIATGLTEIFEIQQGIYDLRPDLKPPFLSERNKNPESNRSGGHWLRHTAWMMKDNPMQLLQFSTRIKRLNPHLIIAKSRSQKSIGYARRGVPNMLLEQTAGMSGPIQKQPLQRARSRSAAKR